MGHRLKYCANEIRVDTNKQRQDFAYGTRYLYPVFELRDSKLIRYVVEKLIEDTETVYFCMQPSKDEGAKHKLVLIKEGILEKYLPPGSSRIRRDQVELITSKIYDYSGIWSYLEEKYFHIMYKYALVPIEELEFCTQLSIEIRNIFRYNKERGNLYRTGKEWKWTEVSADGE